MCAHSFAGRAGWWLVPASGAHPSVSPGPKPCDSKTLADFLSASGCNSGFLVRFLAVFEELLAKAVSKKRGGPTNAGFPVGVLFKGGNGTLQESQTHMQLAIKG